MPSFTTLALLLPVISTVSAHFKLTWPPSRGEDNEDTMASYPCGGLNTVSTTRTPFPINGAPVQIDDEHTQALVGVLLAMGNDPTGDDFTTVLVPTLQTFGPQDFCFGDVDVASVLGSTRAASLDGMNATIMVSTGSQAEGGEGLYNCADVTFTTTALSASDYSANCQNSTGVRAQSVSNGATMNPNGTAVGGTSGSTTNTTAGGDGKSAGSHYTISGLFVAGLTILTALAVM